MQLDARLGANPDVDFLPSPFGRIPQQNDTNAMDNNLDLEPLNLPSDSVRPFVIAGPCSAESEQQVMQTANQLAGKGCHIFRAGVWKPRTKPGGFEGNGEKALPWMKEVKETTHMLLSLIHI